MSLRILRKLKHLKFYLFAITLTVTITLLIDISKVLKTLTTETVSSRRINNKRDLLTADCSRNIKFQNWNSNGFDTSLPGRTFFPVNQLGYVSNLNLQKVHANGQNGSDKRDMYGKYNSHDISCEDLEYNNTLEYHVSSDTLDVDLIDIRKQLLSGEPVLANVFSREKVDGMTVEELTRKKWYAFGTAAVWLESENCYVAYTRIMYSRSGNRMKTYISLVAAQVYDKEWNEIKGKRIMFRDVKIPNDVRAYLNYIQSKIDHNNCKNLENDSLEYEMCVTSNNRNILKWKLEKEEILDKYSIKYPRVLNIPFKMGSIYNGPEDPHVVLKKDNEGEEPIIVFNMDSYSGRRMHAFMPHRKIDPLLQFNIDGIKLKRMEKNWAPFYHKDVMTSGNCSPGYIHLIYDYAPLEVIRCSLLTGHCTYVFQAETLELEKKGTGSIRGGTQYVPLPDVIPDVKDMNIWIGFAKSHVKNCGCGSRFYRPILTLLLESKGIYHLELMTPNIDFDEDVLGWSREDTKCGVYNVLSPSSIANWHVIDQDPVTGTYEDYLTLTVSEADVISKKVVIRGVLNYILGIYEAKQIKQDFEISTEAGDILRRTEQCVMDKLKEECKRYGLLH